MSAIKERVRNYIEEQGMIRPGDAVVAGVSGGADSLCLFLLLHELAPEMGFSLHVVHVHHGLRLSALDDLRFVEDLCDRMQVPCTIVRADAAARAREWGTGVEEAGRRIRYDAFRQLCGTLAREREEEGHQFRIAVAHHREDQAETVLFHLCRGTDLRGARGMLPVSGQIIRPLLCESRASIERFLTEKGFSWQEDETNADTSYTRNYIRKEILPRLEEGVHASAARRISQFAAACAEAEGYLSAVTDRALERCSAACPRGEVIFLPKGAERTACKRVLSLDALKQEDPYLQGRILYRCLADSTPGGKDIGTVHVDALRSLCAGYSDGQLSMPSRVTVFKRGGKIFFCRETGTAEGTDFAEETGAAEGTSLAEETGLAEGPDQAMQTSAGTQKCFPLSPEDYACRLLGFDGCMSAIPGNECTKWFDYDKIGTFPVFRNRQPGDRMHLFSDARKPQDQSGPAEAAAGGGENPGEEDRRLICKKIARIMLDGKIPAQIRDKIVLPFCGNEALWIPGLRMGDSFRVTPTTKRVLEIHWKRGGKDGISNSGNDQRGRSQQQDPRAGRTDHQGL